MNRRLPFVIHDDIDRMVKDDVAADLLHTVRRGRFLRLVSILNF
jgi:hypothetical protein